MKKTRRIPNRFYGWLYIAPAFLLVIFLIAYPLCKTIDMSLRNVVLTNMGSGTPYNKFGNYIKLLNDSDLGRVLLNTIGFVVIGTGLSFLIGLGLALMVNHLTGGWRRLFSSYFLIPYIVPSIVLTLLWMWLFNPSYGVIDYLLSNAGILSPGAPWFTDPVRSPVAILILYIYKSAPFHNTKRFPPATVPAVRQEPPQGNSYLKISSAPGRRMDKFRHSLALENTRLWCLVGQTFLRSNIQGRFPVSTSPPAYGQRQRTHGE